MLTKTCYLVAALVLGQLLALATFPVSARAETTAPVPERIDFATAVARALARNPSVLAARDDVARASALMVQTRAQSMPTLDGYGTYTRLDGDRGQVGNIITHANQLGAGLLLTAPLVSPQRWAAWAHTRDDVDVARQGAAATSRDVAILVAHTYLALVAQHRLLEVQTRARDTAKAHVDYTRERAAAGLGRRLDEVRAAQELEADEAQLEAALAQLGRQQEALGVLIAGDHAVDVQLDVPLASPPRQPLADALTAATRARADVQLSRQRLLAARHRSRDNYADYLPTLVGTFQPFLETPATAQYPATGWQAGLALTVPLFDGGLRRGLTAERAAIESQARVNLEAAERKAVADVRAAQDALARYQRSLAAARSSAQDAGVALMMSELAYRTGTTGNLEVIDAQRAARDAEASATTAEDALRQATLDALIASGRFP